IIAENPGISRKQLAEEIQMPVSTLRWHLGKLTKEHLVISEVKQHTICYSVNPDFIPQDE
ncbi:MAG TPA: winged helix-turn-helix domain-containing protein, partial [Methanocorpusculum sp.]|nr:winged helix-turn-helix domain-containing protein [Methanocorpusculum sp.]